MRGQVVNLLKVLALPLILFLSEFWHQLFQLQGVYLRLSFNLSSAYHPMMGKWELWIVSLRCIWDVSLVVGRKNGWNGFLGKSIVIIQASTAPSKSLLLKLSKEDPTSTILSLCSWNSCTALGGSKVKDRRSVIERLENSHCWASSSNENSSG